MARRVRRSAWTRSFQRTLGALTRAPVRAGAKAAKRAVKQATKSTRSATARRTAPAAAGRWTTGVALGPAGARRYRVCKPPGARAAAPRPLLVMLHGCQQDSAAFARSTRIHALAAREGFFVLCPDQDRLANAQGCWNWYETRSGRAHTEAATIVAAIDQVCAQHAVDPQRIAVAGMSAGASMAALLALRYPQRFAAVAMHSGITPGMAHSSATALSAMHGRRKAAPLPAEALPPLLVIQGSADLVVRASNGRAAAEWWAGAASARAVAARSVQHGKRHPTTLTDYKLKGRTLVTLCEVSGLGHAWSGGAARQPYSDPKGPDASRMIWSFATRQFQSAAKQ